MICKVGRYPEPLPICYFERKRIFFNIGIYHRLFFANIKVKQKGGHYMFTNYNENELLSIEQLCDKLFISHTTAYKLLQSGEIKAFKLGTWKIPTKSVEEYIRNKMK